ncbi:hypothetical protein D9758_004648 [Tetrapyrgos nigripes]|uniref:Uncharacterized protein n=1 Tax=Tetrapyrgos nigripes TaxID=182062 RepID=A0A8H5LYI2_9AGAR|nr:hypothetical protein D9758_004648 [Tetrapyrgos nigripes]
MSSMTYYDNAQASSSSLPLPAPAVTQEPPTTQPIDSASLGYDFSLSRSSAQERRRDRRLSLSDLETQNAVRHLELGFYSLHSGSSELVSSCLRSVLQSQHLFPHPTLPRTRRQRRPLRLPGFQRKPKQNVKL